MTAPKSAMTDLRNDIAKARDAYLASPEGQRGIDGHSIALPYRTHQFLRNRIEAAFIAGWNAKETSNG